MVSGLGFAFSVINLATASRLPRPGATACTFDEPVMVFVPARNERRRLPALLADLRVQTGVRRFRVVVYDDNSADGTAAAAEAACTDDDRFVVIRGHGEPAPGWVGKTAACVAAFEATADTPDDGMLVFLDADVRVHPNAIAMACAQARDVGAGLLCPWPYQRAESWAERVVQPLLAWSWAATLPIVLANRSSRPSTALACGQFLIFDGAAYRAIGGHRSVASSLTEDLDIARVMRRSGYRTAVTSAGRYAVCRMYDGGRDLREGYARWLWSAFRSPAGTVAAATTAIITYVLPPVVIATGSGSVKRWAIAAYAAGAGSRLLARALEKGAAPDPNDAVDALVHPASVFAGITLVAVSHHDHRSGRIRWKGRQLS